MNRQLPAGKEPHIQPMGEEYGTVVYRYQPRFHTVFVDFFSP
jgi:hypothetical protein